MSLQHYFDPVSLEKPSDDLLNNPNLFCKHITIHTPDNPIGNLNGYQVAIIGVPEDRQSLVKGCGLAPDVIRNCLYQLNMVNPKISIYDLGNLKQGKEIKDTYFGLRDVVLELLEKNITVIVLGGSQDLTFGLCLAYEHLKNNFNLTTIDYKFDLAFESYANISSKNYLNTIILESKHLFEYTNIGQQAPFLAPESADIFESLFHEGLRLGSIRNNIRDTEPYLRDSEIVSIDISSIKHSDAPGQAFASANGFLAEDVCQMARYAGFGEKNKVLGIFDVCPALDHNNVTSALAAQIAWYYLDGLVYRKNEFPALYPNEFKQFIITLDEVNNMIFYKSPITQRWWCEVPHKNDKNTHVISCSENDYLRASNHEIPERWLKLLKKLN
jgi:formiminoglutamase